MLPPAADVDAGDITILNATRNKSHFVKQTKRTQNEASVHLHRTHKECECERERVGGGETGGCVWQHWLVVLCCCLSAAACCVSLQLYFSLHTFGRQLKTVWQRRRHSAIEFLLRLSLFLWRHTKYAAALVKCAELKGITGAHTHTHLYTFN